MELYGRSWFSIHDFHSVSFNLEVIFQILDSNTCPRSSSTRIQMRTVPRTRITNEQLASLAQSTRRQYERNWKEWSQWCQTTGVHRLLPPNKERQSHQLHTFARWLFYRPLRPNGVGTILSKISAIGWRHKAALNRTVGLSKQHIIAITGMARIRSPDCRSQPATPAMLRAFYRARSSYPTARDNAIWGSIVLAYFFSMRASEYASTPDKPDHYLRDKDVTFTDINGEIASNLKDAVNVHLFFRSSKNDQTKRGCTRNLSRSGIKHFCPVIAAWGLRDASRTIHMFDECAPLCLYRGRGGLAHQVSISIMSGALKKAAFLCNKDPIDYSSHSLRSGGATEMFLGGCSDTTVQLFGRWKSDAYKAYIRIETSTNSRISTRMISSLGTSRSF